MSFGCPAAMPDENERVDGDVDGERQAAEHELIAPRQAVRIEHRQNVMRDEVALIARFAAGAAQAVFERRQRADPAGELDERAPDDGGDVKPGDARPAEREQPAEHDEDDEREMQRDNERRRPHDYLSGWIDASSCSKFFCCAAIVFAGPVSLKKTLPPGPSTIAPISR